MANQKRRDQIATAALDLFDQRGYHGTGMEDIAKAVGMRASSLYNHYKSKQELLAEVTVSAMEELLRANAAALAGVTGSEEKILATMRAHVIFHATHAKRVRVVNNELNNLEEPHKSVVLQLRRDYVARWMNVVDDLTWLNLVRRLGQLFGEFADVSGQVGLCMDGMACDFDGKRPVFLQGSH
ncbi:HTH-type transcriptional repressor [Corynebacterium striatum]|nr:HTH-type transcriptional repressor [Corynebacterium striatum]